MFASIRRISSPPPCPAKSPKRSGVIPKLKIQHAPATPTFHYDTAYTVTPSPVTTARQDIEDPFSDVNVIARATGARHESGHIIDTVHDRVFDDYMTEIINKLSLETELTTNDILSLYQEDSHSSYIEPTPNDTCDKVAAPTNVEPFPDFLKRSSSQSASHSNNEPGRAQSKARILVDKVKAALKYLEDAVQRFERWTSEIDDKRLAKKRLSQLRRDSIARAKEINRAHEAQINAHRKKEKARNRDSSRRLKEQKKEMREQGKRRDDAAQDKSGFFTGLRKHICKKQQQDSESKEQTEFQNASLEKPVSRHIGASNTERKIEDDALANHVSTERPETVFSRQRAPYYHGFIQYTGLSCAEWEVEEDESADYVFLRGAEEYDPTKY